MTERGRRDSRRGIVFDLDGTLVDSVYAHVLAWQWTLAEEGIEIPAWRVHRRIGMSGGLLARSFAEDIGRELDDETAERISEVHKEWLDRLRRDPRPLPGARDLLQTLTQRGVPWAIATSGKSGASAGTLLVLELPDDAVIVTRDDVARAKPEPDLFLVAAERLGIGAHEVIAVGDSTWDIIAARRAGMSGIGLLTGGYASAELTAAGAQHVYEDPADLQAHLDDLGLG